MPNSVIAEIRESAMIIRFMRPEIRNPLSIKVIESLDRIIDETVKSSAVQKLVFTGSEIAFASGAHLREIAEITPSTAKEFARRGQRLMSTIAALPKPTFAVINGFCFGGALDLAVACSRRIASPAAVFCHPGAGLGIITGWSGTQRLPRLIGRANALEMFVTAEQINSNEALRIGLIDQIAQDPLAESLANEREGKSS